MLKKLSFIYSVFWLVLLCVGLFVSQKFMLSSQVAFFSSLAVVAASFYSYKKRVLSRLDDEEFMQSVKQNDEDDDIQESDVENFSLKDEKDRLKKQKISLKDMSLTTAFVPYRLIAYALVLLGFLVLRRQESLDIFGFLIGLSGMPFGALMLSLWQEKI
ncbi:MULTISPECIES: hypothetical protein [unclassified Campylobacter]|uniref:hypothetical protein n=1 Tax=unclassified Campylobacter TaxID=2593542 RepID=UPI003D353B1E